MSTNPTYTINIEPQPAKQNLLVTVPELGIVLETLPGQVKRDDAVDLALARISEYQRKMYEESQARAS